MNSIILEVQNLTKKFGTFTAVDNISFTLEEGEILGLLGPNGAGKTTTIQMLLGVMEQTLGTIEFFGKSFEKHREEILRQVNFASTYISLPYTFTVGEILEIFSNLYSVQNYKKRIQKLLFAFDIEQMQKKNFYKLSAGERTRVILAKAFLNFPRVILLDEPTASLDPEIAVKVRNFLKLEQKEYMVSMLLTSHNMAEVEEMCDRVMILHHGTIIEEGTPESLAAKFSECEISLFIKEHQKAIALFAEKKLTYSQDNFRFSITIDEKQVAQFLSELATKKITFQEITINKPDLEDYFLKRIEEEKNE